MYKNSVELFMRCDAWTRSSRQHLHASTALREPLGERLSLRLSTAYYRVERLREQANSTWLRAHPLGRFIDIARIDCSRMYIAWGFPQSCEPVS